MIPFFVFGETGLPQVVKVALMLGLSAALFFYLIDKKKIALIVGGVATLTLLISYFVGAELVWYNFSTMRIPGVLQRIAVCYLIVSLIFLHTSWKQQTAIAIALILIYWLLMTAVPVPGCEITTIDDKACNLAAWFDRTILTEAHIWRSAKVFDPEGILSTIPAIATTLSGVLAGTWLTRKEKEERRTDKGEPGVLSFRTYPFSLETALGLFFFGTLMLAIGWAWSLLFPLNKSLWTSSYVVYTTGLALLTLAVCYYLIDIKGYKKWSRPFVVFGVNALALFVFSGIMARMLGLIKLDGTDDKVISLQQWIFNTFFLTWASPANASLAYAVCFILFWLFLMWLLYRRRILIKV
jgi:predicted acyltransferase